MGITNYVDVGVQLVMPTAQGEQAAAQAAATAGASPGSGGVAGAAGASLPAEPASASTSGRGQGADLQPGLNVGVAWQVGGALGT